MGSVLFLYQTVQPPSQDIFTAFSPQVVSRKLSAVWDKGGEEGNSPDG